MFIYNRAITEFVLRVILATAGIIPWVFTLFQDRVTVVKIPSKSTPSLTAAIGGTTTYIILMCTMSFG